VLSRDREQHKHLLVLPGLALENCDVYEGGSSASAFAAKTSSSTWSASSMSAASAAAVSGAPTPN
jgi:hypothetical protein